MDISIVRTMRIFRMRFDTPEVFMRKYIDLHTHSCFSDGTDTPAELIDKAIERGLCAIALTDHNTTGGLMELISYAEGKNIYAIPGIEISSDYGEKELHIVGLFLEPQHFAKIEDVMREMNRRKTESNINLINNLKADGYDIDYESVSARTSGEAFNRAHVAAHLVEKGYFEKRQDAFKTVLAKNGKYYHAPKRITAIEAIRLLRSCDAVPILAHPYLSLDEYELLEFLPEAKKAGLVGMETIYSSYDRETEIMAAKIAARFSLFESGGSDYHGKNKVDVELGVGKGEMAVPKEILERLLGVKLSFENN